MVLKNIPIYFASNTLNIHVKLDNAGIMFSIKYPDMNFPSLVLSTIEYATGATNNMVKTNHIITKSINDFLKFFYATKFLVSNIVIIYLWDGVLSSLPPPVYNEPKI